MEITYCPECRTDELLSYYPFLRSVDVYVADNEFFDWAGLSNALAVTDRESTIIVRQNLPYPLFRHSMFHECEHFVQNFDTPEYLVDIEARKKDGFNYNLNSYGNLKYEVKLNSQDFGYSMNSWADSDKKEKGMPAYLS